MSVAEVVPAKDRFTALDTLAVVRELRAAGRMFIDKVFDAGPNRWEITLRVPGAGKRALLVAPGRYAALRKDSETHSTELGPVSRELRRLLSGGSVVDVIEPLGERYLELEVHRGEGDGTLRLIAEFFGPGNLLVVRNGKLVAVAHPRTWAHRAVRVGAAYRPPPSRSNPWQLTAAELEAALNRSRTDRVRTLAAPLGFGGPAAEEILARAGLSGSEAAPKESPRAAREVERVVTEILAEIGDRPPGFLYRRGGSVLDVEPFSSHRWRAEVDIEERRFENFSEAAHEYFTEVEAPAEEIAEDPAAGLRRQQEQQERAIAELETEIQELKVQAETIFANYAEAERLVARADMAEVEGRVLATLGGRQVSLLGRRSPRESAERLYAEAKRARTKLEGARAALEVTRRKITEAGTSVASATVTRRAIDPRPKKPRWFERYRWFLSSEGIVVIGGRDAASNDLIVRRYLRARDLYVHADVHGAASVIVKRSTDGAPEPTEVTLREAGQWAVSFSKAWRVGLASADAFWVTAEQVSKSGATGEFVPRGAWMIHGTKRWLRDLPLELGLGVVAYEGDDSWSVAPPSALRSRGTLRFLLTPGDERERLEREAELAREAGVSRDLLQRLLPAGGVSVRRA